MLEVIALSPPCFPTPMVAQAAHRAGYSGGVALEYIEPGRIKSVLDALSATDTEFTVSINRLTSGLLPLLESSVPYDLKRVILSDFSRSGLEEEIAALRKFGVRVLVQVTCSEDAEWAEQLGADGLVVKGNESGGRVGEETTFILLQRIVLKTSLPVWARGGVGLHTAAACLTVGATGVVLDWQLALCEESGLPEPVKVRVARMDGSETAILGQDCPIRYRVYARPGETAYFELKAFEEAEALQAASDPAMLAAWEKAVGARVVDGRDLLMIGQDAAFAAPLAEKYRTVGGICRAINREARRQCRTAANLQALRPGGALAQSHETRYPIVQGPMTRVSDRADFALAVAEGGALPFLALALLRGPQVAKLLEETKQKLGNRPWGIGILGFVPKKLREEQLSEVVKHSPPYAIIAGGRPDQAEALERGGIHTYLHVPSPELLKMFLKSGARRVIFEGRECGGHVGPRTSFVLWESMIRVILTHLAEAKDRGETYHVLFAGGIHDGLSAAMVTALAAPLSERGVRIGVLMGTSYLFTEEAVATGATTEGYQKEALACRQTVLLESGVGHATRCANSPFGDYFAREKRRLIREGRSKEEIREALETLNLGRLRIAAKGIARGEDVARPRDGGGPSYISIDEETQRRDGMYMIGQIAALREKVCSIKELHEEVGRAGEYLEAAAGSSVNAEVMAKKGNVAASPVSSPFDVAIIGLSCMFPKAKDLPGFWHNILNKVNGITEVPKERWDIELYFDPDRRAPDKVYSRWGGFLDERAFDPVRYGMPPNSVPSVEPLQLLVLEAARDALEDAGYLNQPFDREHTSVILGVGGGIGDLGLGYSFRSLLPYFVGHADGTAAADRMINQLDGDLLPQWTEDSFAGLLLNVAAGRVANRFDLGGSNYTVDAACASSLAALRLAIGELESRSSNMVIVGGADTMQGPFSYLCFSKTQALSPTGQCKTYDESADGIVISEGIAIAVLKRLEDAERDGDHIYAVIKSVGSSSDGKDKGLTAPRPIGQIHALERAYAKAGFTPDTVSLVEAHGTGTVVGDRTEVESLTKVFQHAGAETQSCALGSVKSMIGHTKCTAGMAGLVKAALALSQKILPPTASVTKPNPNANFPQSPFYLNTEVRPWIKRPDGTPRRAGVSAFGFGGTNFHAVLEEYSPVRGESEEALTLLREWPAELLLWRGQSLDEITGSLDQIETAIKEGAAPLLRDVAAAVCRTQGRGGETHCLAIVASSLEDLETKIAWAKISLNKGDGSFRDPRGIYYSAKPLGPDGKVAFVFPGQGSQSVNMLRDLVVAYPGLRSVFEHANQSLGNRLGKPLSEFIFPQPTFSSEEKTDAEAAVTRTDIAQPAMGAADVAVYRLLSDLGVQPEIVCGHSYGEYVALCAAGVIRFEDLIRISEARGRFIMKAAEGEPGTMAAIDAGESVVSPVVDMVAGASIANLNSPQQTVISGTPAGVAEVLRRLSEQGVAGRLIRVSCAFHSNLVAGAREPLREFLDNITFRPPRLPVFSNTIAAPHSTDPDEIRTQLVEHLVRPVRFADEVNAMYEAGARIFVEIGPGKILTGLVERTLGGRSFLAVAMDQPGRHGLLHLMHALAQLATAGVKFHSYKLFEGRVEQRLDLAQLVEQTKPIPLSPTTWMVNGARAVPIGGKKESSTPPRPVTRRALQEEGESAPMPPASQVPAPPPAPQVRGETTVAINETFHAGNGDHPKNTAALSTASRSGLPGAEASAPPQRAASVSSSFCPANGEPDSALAPLVEESGVEATMRRYHQLMSKFLDTQKNIMLSYLQAGRNASSIEDALSQDQPTRGGYRVDPRSSNGNGYMVPQGVRASHAVRTPEAEPPAEPSRQALPAISVLSGQPSTAASIASSLSVERGVGVDAAEQLDSPALTRERLMNRLISVVSERTGYPPEMLDVDADLEADLGVDSIKRVEILSALQSDSILSGESGGNDIEVLSKLKNLRTIADWILSRAGAAEKTADNETIDGTTSSARVADAIAAVTEDEEVVSRMSLAAVELQGEKVEQAIPPKGLVLITDDGRGIAPLLAGELSRLGVANLVVKPNEEVDDDHATPVVNLLTRDAVAEFFGKVRRRHGPVGGLIHLMPLTNNESHQSTNPADWESALDAELYSLFHLAQHLESDLRASGSGSVLVATRMGGSFASAGEGKAGDFWPGHGGVCGLVKTLSREWSEVSCKALDFELDSPPEEIVKALLFEVGARDGLVEVGYQRSRRRTLRPTPAPLEEERPNIRLDQNSVVLITGGARGITAGIAIELIEKFGCNLVLVGRSPLPHRQESPATAHLTDPVELKKALLEQAKKFGQEATPLLIEARYKSLRQEREMRSNLAAMQSAGGTVEYHSVDVTDSSAFGALIDDVYRRYGRIDGVIHGAGVIEDKLVRDKSPESFERVVKPKVVGALTLASKLRAESLKFLFFFSSVSARYGNRGQCDYAAANEVLNKLAVWLNARWPGRVASLNWGPWKSEGGMVSAELAKQFAEAGVELIAPPAGRKAFVDELLYGRKDEAEVLFGGPLPEVKSKAFAKAAGTEPRQSQTPSTYIAPLLASGVTTRKKSDGSFEALCEIDPARDIYLLDHQLDGKPVLPMAMVLELLSEVVTTNWPHLHLATVRGLRALHGITFERGIAQTLRVKASVESRSERAVEVNLEVESASERPQLHYAATIELRREPVGPIEFENLKLINDRSLPVSVAAAYEKWLFHGPRFAGIVEVDGIGENGVIARLSPSSPENFFTDARPGAWFIDPVVIDSGLQLLILWARAYLDMTPLPSQLGCYHRFGPPSSTDLRCEVRVSHNAGSPIIHADLKFFDAGGRLLGWLEGMEVTCSKALNRLAGKMLVEAKA
ncbi:MAG: SDR family NAD(P)-dependent oxidoreductase [Acidobacteria bacterium]|nr:SDR family NAD(P)-dependent oxidoreductase [Acidobacteriota bacterium]